MPGKGHEKNVGEINLLCIDRIWAQCVIFFPKCEKNYVFQKFVHFILCKFYLKYNRIENYFEL